MMNQYRTSKTTTTLLMAIILSIWATEKTGFATLAFETVSIYDTLKAHGLPMGLFPNGVKNYSMNEDGRFEVFLEHECNAKFESELHYDEKVSGQLSFGMIRNLTGISAQDLFLWFPVKGIRVDVPSSGIIYFDVGVVYKQFSLSLFETPPDCVAASHPPDDLEDESPTVVVDNVLAKKWKGGLRYHFNKGSIGREFM